MKFHDIAQNSDEWLALRAGKVTSSALSKIMANYGKSFGNQAKDYAVKLCAEQASGEAIQSGYSNSHTERGHEQEPRARMQYEQETFCTVTNGGFFELGDIGCSPDGLVGDDGVIEIKSVIASVHYANIKRQSFDPAYKWQLIGNLKFTDRAWLDFISYSEDFPLANRLYVYRLHAENYQQEFKQIDARLDEFFNYMDEVRNTMFNSKYFLSDKEVA